MDRNDPSLFLEILDLNTNSKITQEIHEPTVTYPLILDIIQAYSPQIDTEVMTLYYDSSGRGHWQLFLQDDKLDLKDKYYQYDPQTNRNTLHLKYHCYYFIEDDEEGMEENLSEMRNKIQNVQQLYKNIKEQYIQEAIDINIFWGCPSWTEDMLRRSTKKPMQIMKNIKGQEVQLLNNQVKYWPYVSAVNSVLENCQKKVLLYLKPFNADSFKKKSIFTVTYIIAHVEMEEVKGGKDGKKEGANFHLQQKKSAMAQMSNVREGLFTTIQRLNSELVQPIPAFQRNFSQISPSSFSSSTLQPSRPYLSTPSSIIGKSSAAVSEGYNPPVIDQSDEIDIVPLSPVKSQQKSIDQDLTLKVEFSRSIQPNQLHLDIPAESTVDYPEVIEQELTEEQASQTFSKKKSSDKRSDKRSKHSRHSRPSHPAKKPKHHVYNLWGQWNNGQLCKISPDRLDKMMTGHRQIQLLILQTSYPDQHLKIFKKKAKNIILINSNPLYPEPNAIFFVKQLFTFLVRNGNIQQAFNQARFLTQRLKSQDSINMVPSSQRQFLRRITQKYVHGSHSTCCCYHQHLKQCTFYNNHKPSKYAEHHYRCHYVVNCECNPEHLMWHHCDKKTIMKKQYNVLDQNYKEKDFYYCCCLGYELGYYKKIKGNKTYKDDKFLNEVDDPHSWLNKFVLLKGDNSYESNKLQIYDGRLKGDCHQDLFDAFRFREENSLIGNVEVTIKLLEIFTSSCKDITICNIHGKRRSGRKTIAVHWSKMAIIKQFYHRVVNVRVTMDNISQVIKKELEKNKQQGPPLFVFIFADQVYGQYIELHEDIFNIKANQKINAIVITEDKVRISGDHVELHYLQPQPFKVEDCLAYIKMYKHLTRAGKKNLEVAFEFVRHQAGLRPIQSPDLYPCSLNEFQILNIIHKTNFEHDRNFEHKPDYKKYALALTRMKHQYIPYYVFIMSIIKFTTSHDEEDVLRNLKNELVSIRERKVLFYKGYKATICEQKQQDPTDDHPDKKHQKHDESYLFQALINFNHLKNHYYLMYLFLAQHLKPKAIATLKLFLNYSTTQPIRKHSYYHKEPHTLRTKLGEYEQQVYEATTINNVSYISKYFKRDLDQVLRQFQKDKKWELKQIEDFLKEHAALLENKRLLNKKTLSDSHPKSHKKGSEGYHSVSLKQSHEYSFHQHEPKEEEATDIPHIHHLAAVMQAGLQYVRMIVSTHFIYNRFDDAQKIEMLKYSLLLINNCIILMKNKTFAKMTGNFDLDQESSNDLHHSRRLFEHSGSLVPQFIPTMRSEAQQREMPQLSRNFSSGRQLYQSRQIRDTRSDRDDKVFKSDKNDNELLIKQLYRLSTYKGLLYLLSQLQKRCDQVSNENILDSSFETAVKLKISIQLLGIQVRLEQSHLTNSQTKINCSVKDRHLSRLNEVFNEKNYNILTLKRIVREQVSRNRYNADSEEIALIKAHIIVALSLMSSGYGRYKLVRDNFMIEDIENFLNDWNYEVPTDLRKGESQMEVSQSENEQITQPSSNNTIFEFMRFICQNQSTYLHIVTSFNSQAFWQTPNHNSEVQLYQNMLRLYHLFSLRNTQSKGDFYQKLQVLQCKLNNFKREREFSNNSTYLHNFIDSFMNQVKSQMHKLQQHLVLTLTAESETVQNDVRMSIGQRIDNLLENTTGLFSIRKKLSRHNLQSLVNHHKCNYLIIYASTNKNNEKELWIQTENGRKSYSRESICQDLSRSKFKLAFICLPKKTNLAELLIQKNPRKRIIYFDFSYDSFIFATQKYRKDQPLFEKMIMMKTVSDIMRNIITLEREGSKTFITDSFARARKSLSFQLREDNNSEMIALRNDKFKKCVFMHGIQSTVAISGIDVPSKEIKTVILKYNERITKNHLEIINKFLKVLYRSLSSRIDISEEKKQFLKVFAFYFKQRLNYQFVITISMDQLKGGNRRDDKIILKNFYKKLIELKLFDYIFSNRKVILILQLREQDNKLKDLLDNTIHDALNGYSDKDRQGRRHTFECVHRNHLQALIYFFEYGNREILKEYQGLS